MFQKISGLNQWIDVSKLSEDISIADRCDVKEIQTYLDESLGIPGTEVVSADVNRSGTFSDKDLFPSYAVYKSMPVFCDIRIMHQTGKYSEEIKVWVPLRWNHRFMGVHGICNRTAAWLPDEEDVLYRTTGLVTPLRNGFACACSDGGVRGEMGGFAGFSYGYYGEGGQFNADLYYNFNDYSTHMAAVIGKAVTTFVGGHAPCYSYCYGGSGGGRQSLTEAQKYPEDYDGIWADCPCLYWNTFALGTLWPVAVMNTYKNVMPAEKFEAFREAVWEKAGGREAYYRTTDVIEIDTHKLVGKETPAGVITETDAVVMEKIWQGPATKDGMQIWFGYRPGATIWLPGGVAAVRCDKGRVKACPEPIGVAVLNNWLLHGRECDVEAVTADSDATIKYYSEVVKVTGSETAANEFVRLFIIPGDGHGTYTKYGHGPSKATGMQALMRWVEEGTAPDEIEGSRVDPVTKKIQETAVNKVYRLCK